MLTVDQLSFRHRGATAPALEEVSFQLAPGSLNALLGPNGAGKSTLLRCLLDQRSRQTGRLLWNGGPLAPGRPRMALVPQRSAIRWEVPIRVRDLVGLGTLGLPRGAPQPGAVTVSEALALLSLSASAEERLDRLSGGQQQRAVLARALVQNAELLLLDEPFSHLDPGGRAELLRVLRQQARSGRIVLLSSHDWGSSLSEMDQVLLLDRRLRQQGPPEAVRERLLQP